MLGVLTDQAHNLVLLAEDEARMLGDAAVEPHHVMLALTRHGNVESALRARGITGRDVHAAILRETGLGDQLVPGRVPRSRAAEEAVARSVDIAAARGVLGPSSEHLLLAVATDERTHRILARLDIEDPEELVEAGSPRRAPVGRAQLQRYLARAGGPERRPSPGPVPPVFERYTREAHRAVRAGIETASILEHAYVEPFHLLLGCLHVPDCAASRALEAELEPSDVGRTGEAMERARVDGPAPAHQATGIFTDAAREVVAQGALRYAYRRGDELIGTGHLLLGVLDAGDPVVDRLVGGDGMGGPPRIDRLRQRLLNSVLSE